jgi:hypothetical protein
MYVSPNYPSKAALRRALVAGERVTVFAPGLGTPSVGRETVEGPHYPRPHTWYAQVATERDGNDIIVTRVIS